MNLSKSPLRRRTSSVVVGAALGLAGMLATAAPALACHTIIKDSACLNKDGSWVVTWEVANSERHFAADVTAVSHTPEGSQFSGIAKGDVIPAGGKLVATQVLASDAGTATISVTADWSANGKNYTQTSNGTENKPTGKRVKHCKEQPPTSPSPSPSVSVPPPSPSVSVSPSESVSASPSQSTSASPSASASVSTSPSTPPASPSTGSPTPSTTTSTGPEPEVTEPVFVYDATCEILAVGIEVPATWKESITATFTPSVGAAKTVTAKPGETQWVEFEASEGLKVTATPKGYEDEAATITYEAPGDCEDGEGGGLPVTGAAATGIAGGAVALLVIGGALFFMARRRKVNFTA